MCNEQTHVEPQTLNSQQATTLGKVKHFFPGFTIRFRRDHSFVNSARAPKTLIPGNYQG